jgi:hypothetical protein
LGSQIGQFWQTREICTSGLSGGLQTRDICTSSLSGGLQTRGICTSGLSGGLQTREICTSSLSGGLQTQVKFLCFPGVPNIALGGPQTGVLGHLFGGSRGGGPKFVQKKTIWTPKRSILLHFLYVVCNLSKKHVKYSKSDHMEMASDCLRRPQTASGGLRWPQMASDSLRWPQMASDGLRWPQVASDGCRWPQMASDGFRWPQMALDFKLTKVSRKNC